MIKKNLLFLQLLYLRVRLVQTTNRIIITMKLNKYDYDYYPIYSSLSTYVKKYLFYKFHKFTLVVETEK